MLNFLNYVYRLFIDAIFPWRCMICGSFFTSDHFRVLPEFEKSRLVATSFQQVMKPFLCPLCLENYSEVKSPKCTMCGFMFKSREGKDHICGNCIKNPFKFGKARAYGLYDRSLRKSIHCLKYHQKAYLGEPLGLLLYSTFIQNWDPDKIHVIIPVPLHIGRMKKRGFNQTYQLIGKWPEWSQKFTPEPVRVNIDQDILFRKKRTKAQVGMGKKERIKNIKGVFEVAAPLKIEGKNVLLVDDVLTTGATANECVRLLMEKGAQNVDLLTLAHTERRS